MPTFIHAVYEMTRKGWLPRPAGYELSWLYSHSSRVAQACWVRVVKSLCWICLSLSFIKINTKTASELFLTGINLASQKVRIALDETFPGYEFSWLRVVLDMSYLGYELSCYELAWVRVVLGMNRLGCKFSSVRVVLGISCLWYELSRSRNRQ